MNKKRNHVPILCLPTVASFRLVGEERRAMSKGIGDLVASGAGAFTWVGSVVWTWIGTNSTQLTVLIAVVGLSVNWLYAHKAYQRRFPKDDVQL